MQARATNATFSGWSWQLAKLRRLTLTMHELIARCAELAFKTDEIEQFE